MLASEALKGSLFDSETDGGISGPISTEKSAGKPFRISIGYFRLVGGRLLTSLSPACRKGGDRSPGVDHGRVRNRVGGKNGHSAVK